jgi:hypothetical protein
VFKVFIGKQESNKTETMVLSIFKKRQKKGDKTLLWYAIFNSSVVTRINALHEAQESCVAQRNIHNTVQDNTAPCIACT